MLLRVPSIPVKEEGGNTTSCLAVIPAMNDFEIEAVPEYEPKKTTELRIRALGLASKANDAADVVEQFGEAHFDGQPLIDAADVSAMVKKLRHYSEWLMRIANGEAVTEDDLVMIEETLASLRVPKAAGKPKNEMIEIAYLGIDPKTGSRTRKRIWATIVTDEPNVDIQNLHVDLTSLRAGAVSVNKEGEDV